jgi:hypothetical protein
MKNTLNLALATLLLTTTSMTVTAAEDSKSLINYDYVQAGFGNFELSYDGESIDGDYTIIGASTSLSNDFNLFGSILNDREDIVDVSWTKIGLGYHTPIDATTDLQISYTHDKLEASVDGVSESVTGSTVSIGIASALSDATEVSIALVRTTMEGESVNGYSAGFVQEIDDSLSAVGSFETATESGVTAKFTSLLLRFNF